MEVLAATLEALRQKWEPTKGRGTSPSLRDGILIALGVDPRLGPMAYLEYGGIRSVLADAVTGLGGEPALAKYVQTKPALRDEVATLLTTAAVESPVEPLSATPTLRPYVSPKAPMTGRVPFVPVAAVCSAALADAPTQPLKATLDRLGVGESSDPWEVLASADAATDRYSTVHGVVELANAVVALGDSSHPHPLLAARATSSASLLLLAAEVDVPVVRLAEELGKR